MRNYPTADELVGALHQLNVHFLSGETQQTVLAPAQLLAGLAIQPNTRLRLALVPLLLSHPHLATSLADAVERLPETAALNLKLFYTAAMLLQERYAQELHDVLGQRMPLPDWFSQELGVSRSGSAEQRLAELGQRHQQLLGVRANWTGTYHHGVKRLIKRLTCEREWRN